MAAGHREAQNLTQLVINFCKAQHSRICEEVGRIDRDTPTASEKVDRLLNTENLAQYNGSCNAVYNALIEACMYHQNGNLLVFFGLMDEKDREVPETMKALLKQPWYPALEQLSKDPTYSSLPVSEIFFAAGSQTIYLAAHDHRPAAAAPAAIATAGTGEAPDTTPNPA